MSNRHPIAVATLAIITLTFSYSGLAPFGAEPVQGATLAERMSGFKNLFKEKDSNKQKQQQSTKQSRTPSRRLGRPSYRHTDHASRSRPDRSQQAQSRSQTQSKGGLSKYLPKSLFGKKEQENQTAQSSQRSNRQQRNNTERSNNRDQQQQIASKRTNPSLDASLESESAQRPSIDAKEAIVESVTDAPKKESLKSTSIRKSPSIARRDDLQEALSDLQDSESIMPGSVVIDSETVVIEEGNGGNAQSSTAIAMDDYGFEVPEETTEAEIETIETVEPAAEPEAEALVIDDTEVEIEEATETTDIPLESEVAQDGQLEIVGQVPAEPAVIAEEETEPETELQVTETDSVVTLEVADDTVTSEVSIESESPEQTEPQQLTVTEVPFGESELDIHDALLSEELYEQQTVESTAVARQAEEPQQEEPAESLLVEETPPVESSESTLEQAIPVISVPAEPIQTAKPREFAVQEIDIDALQKTFEEEATEATEVEATPDVDVFATDSDDSQEWNAATIPEAPEIEVPVASESDSASAVASKLPTRSEPPGPEFFDEVIQKPVEKLASPVESRRVEKRVSKSTVESAPRQKREVTRLVRPRGDVLTTVEQPVIRSHVEGPRSILVGKEASYRVVLENTSQTAAENLSALVKVPEWAELVDVVCSDGLVEQVRNKDNADSLQWTLPKLAAHSSQTMQLKLIPRSGRSFQLGVQWKQQPTSAETLVQVQEPKLTLKLNGPDEVLFGDSRRYQLILENPGNAPAENVAISLIPPGSDSDSASTTVLGTLKPQEVKELELELTAREAGEMVLHAFATGKNDLRADAIKRVKCQKPELEVDWRGPDEKYAGTETAYYFRVRNPGNAVTSNVEVKVQLPKGIKFLSASDSFSYDSRSGLVLWKLDQLKPKEEQFMQVRCELDLPGKKEFEVEASAVNGLVIDTKTIRTDVVALADLKLEVRDPRGAQPTGEPVNYEIRVENRGSTDAEGISIVGLFSQGIDPVSVEGAESSVKDGRVNFQAIKSLPPGGEVVLNIRAVASEVGMHIFRAEVACQDLDIKLAAEETTRFFEDNFGWNEGEKPYTAVRSKDTLRR